MSQTKHQYTIISSDSPVTPISQRRWGKTWISDQMLKLDHSLDAVRYILCKWELPAKRWPLRRGRQIEHIASGNIYELIRIYSEVGSRVWIVKLLKRGTKSKIPLKIPNVLPDLVINKEFTTIPSKAEKVLYDKRK